MPLGESLWILLVANGAGATLAKSIKDKIAKLYDDESLNENDYYSFKPFLDELIKLSNL